ncbi:AtzH-like domain-containing protein [Ruania halotolerans]|uniref:AtzH-like domain-containing protein n=1 Tax=Ruania halotolerans TaxID=2897773 RepID=UPI001E3EAF12|nr:AtzH-like domain-containing protein [Ruania halotolerans]UFU07037.1 DUF3225 domain-containing protein [Ruania halotolerans]
MSTTTTASPATTQTPDGWPDTALRTAFWAYERALMSDDVPALDALFAPGAETLRSDADATTVGHAHIAAFRAGRGGAPARHLLRVHVRDLGDHALVVAENERIAGGTGVQTQVWQRGGRGWQVIAAHVSGAPETPRVTDPAALTDPTIWRVAPGTKPLAEGTPGGPLAGASVAVKDLFAVGGHRIGAGTPAWLETAPVQPDHAGAVTLLLEAGADVIGLAHTDELAFSLAGTNSHYGTPPNAAAPGHITGGSTSGPAAAVAAGVATIGLGTDTAGSIRVPAAYCGLYGLRTTHDAVPRDGLVGLATSFDTAGLLTRDLDMLRTAARALVPPAPAALTAVAVAPALFDLADEETRLATLAAVRALDHPVHTAAIDPDALDTWFAAFRTVQQAEAWELHGDFVTAHADTLEPAVRERFRAGATTDPADVSAARRTLTDARDRLLDLLDGAALALPTTSAPAPRRDADATEIAHTRAGTLRLTCLASLAGLPQVSAPLPRVGPLPAGLGLIGPPGADLALLDLLENR